MTLKCKKNFTACYHVVLIVVVMYSKFVHRAVTYPQRSRIACLDLNKLVTKDARAIVPVFADCCKLGKKNCAPVPN